MKKIKSHEIKGRHSYISFMWIFWMEVKRAMVYFYKYAVPGASIFSLITETLDAKYIIIKWSYPGPQYWRINWKMWTDWLDQARLVTTIEVQYFMLILITDGLHNQRE